VVSDLFDLSGYGLMGVQLLRGVVRAAPALPAPAPFRAAKREALPQLEQVAFVTREEAGARALVEMFGLLGATEWVEDEVTAIGTVRGTPHCTNTAHLRFNYQLIKGIELEVLTYTAGRNWHESRWVNMDTVVAFSHIGVHVEDIVAVTNQMIDLGLTVAQQVTTSKHTNPAIAGKRTYKYVVFDSRGMLGFDLKLIQRIT
jgi:hypothetical protein